MKRYWNNPYMPLRNEADELEAGGAGSGLAAGLDQFVEDNPGAGAVGIDEPPRRVVDNDDDEEEFEEEIIDEEEEDESDEIEGSDDEEEEEEFDSGLPRLGKQGEEKVVEKPESFNAAEFEKQTEAVLKKMEKDGHPGAAYKQARDEIKELRSKIAEGGMSSKRVQELEEELVTLRDKADQFEAMQERVKRVTSKSAELMLIESDDYQNQVNKPYKEIQSSVTALAKTRDVPESKIWGALKEPDPVKRTEMIDALEDEIGPRHALTVQQMADELRAISRMDKEMRENAEELVKKAKDQEITMTQQELDQRNQAVRNAAAESFTQYASKIPGLTDDSGNLNEIGRKLKAQASIHDVNKLANSDLGYMIFTAEALPEAIAHIRKLEAENRDLRVANGDTSGRIGGGSRKRPKKSGSDTPGRRPAGLLSHMQQQDFSRGV